jgi:hypothetical protein
MEWEEGAGSKLAHGGVCLYPYLPVCLGDWR